MTKEHTFELSGCEIKLDLQHSFNKAENEATVLPPDNLDKILETRAKAIVAIWKNEILSECSSLEFYNMCSNWGD